LSQNAPAFGQFIARIGQPKLSNRGPGHSLGQAMAVHWCVQWSPGRGRACSRVGSQMGNRASQDVELYEEIGPWTEVKLDIIRKYAHAYSTILSAQERPPLAHVYVDAFAGAGRYVSRRSGELVPGSPRIALLTDPPFQEYHFIDIDQVKVRLLEEIAGKRPNVTVYHGDCNKILIERVLPRIRYEDYRRGLCILDPYGLHLEWRTVQAIAKMRTIEVFLNFPIMDMNRNALRKDPNDVAPDQARRMTTFWGDDSWRSLFYQKEPQLVLWGDQPTRKTVTNDDVVGAYLERLRKVAGFSYVPQPLAMRNSTSAVVYYLIFASHKAVAGDIVEQIFAKYREG